MSDDLDRLYKLAEAATPGPWSGGVCRAYRDEDGKRRGAGSVRREGGAIVFMSANGPEILEDDVKFIAAANPKVVRALVQRVRDAERQRDNAEKQVEIRSRDSIAARIARQNVRAVEEWARIVAERDAALAREAKVRELHADVLVQDWATGMGGYVCGGCHVPVESEPCPTIRALDADGKETNDAESG